MSQNYQYCYVQELCLDVKYVVEVCNYNIYSEKLWRETSLMTNRNATEKYFKYLKNFFIKFFVSDRWQGH